jgi:hypothetical protein
MALRTISSEWIICPGCGKKHSECPDWVKSMPHRELCSCGAEMLCWSETEITYHAELLGGPEKEDRKRRKKKLKKKDGKKKKKKDRKKR